MRSRIVLILIVLTAMWAMLIGRAAFLQLLPDARLQALQKRKYDTVVTLHARRGDVLDRNGKEIAASMTAYSLFADPKLIEERRKVAKLLARELSVPAKQIEDKLHGKQKRFIWIERLLDKNVRDSIQAMIDKEEIKGLGFVEESRRVYPNEQLLSQVVGFVGNEENGLEGLELRYNEQLQAEKKKVNMHKDARGRPLLIGGQIFNQAPDGADVELTVDRDMQFILEQELAEAVSQHQADSAVGVVLDAQTSEVLAMASSPSFDPNRPNDFGSDRKRNRVITDSYEPGSTMKTFVIAGALNKGLIEPNTKIDCEGGVMRIGKRVIHEAESKEKFGDITVGEILARSSNIGASKIGFKMGEAQVLASLQAFGFGEKTGIDLPGEVRGIVQPLPWSEHLLANVSFGQGISATALQIANAYAAIANGGYLKQPFVVKAVRDHDSGEIVETKPKIIRRILSDTAVAKMRMMLTEVTAPDGTGFNARVPGYPVAGKTGTAQKVNPNGRGYLPGGYVSSFAGFLPANDPRFVIYVAVDHPRKEHFGAAVAAPVFSRIAKYAVRKAGLQPVLITQENLVPNNPVAAVKGKSDEPVVANIPAIVPAQAAADTVPDLAGLTLREVLARVTGTGVSIQVHGQGFVTHTLPASGTRLSNSKELAVYLEQ